MNKDWAHHLSDEVDVITITYQRPGDRTTTRFRIRLLARGQIEIDGDELSDSGGSNCDGVGIGPVDMYTIQMWTI